MPLSVLMPFGMTVPGWQPALPAQPEWWDLPVVPATEPAAQAALPMPARRRPAAAPVGQRPLFESPEVTQLVLVPVPGITWIDALLQSAVYASQRQLAARVAPPDDLMRRLLVTLADRGGVLSRAALAQRLSVPEVRLNPLLSAVRRVLNVDQSEVIVIDETAGMIKLNQSLLLQQFAITTTGKDPR